MPRELTPVLGHPPQATGPANLPETPLVPGVSKSKLRRLPAMSPFLEHIEFSFHNQKEQLYPLPRQTLHSADSKRRGAGPTSGLSEGE